MIDFGTGFLYWTASTLIPAFVGLITIIGASKWVNAKYLAAFAFGIFLWFFVDTIGGAANLDVNSGFSGGVGQVAVVILFILGLMLTFSIDRNRYIFSPESAIGKLGLAIPILVSIAIGIHGMGEGADYGSTIYQCSNLSPLDCFGGINAGIAYVLHKGLEPMVIGACYAVYSRVTGARSIAWVKHAFLFGILFVIPSLVGAPIGYFLIGPGTGIFTGFNTTYFYGFGTGTSIYAAIRLVGPLFKNSTVTVSSKETLILAIAIVLGLITIYFAALFHSG